jgi:WD40 repeat protein/serine/threonine protein kinase
MTHCPGRDKLERLLVAPCGDGAGEELVRHVESCPTCQQALESMTGTADWGSDLESWPAPAPRPAPQPDSFLRWLQQAPAWAIDRVARRRDPVRAHERGRSIEPGLAPGPSATAVSPTEPRATLVDDTPGRVAPTVAGYEILGELGRGGMGVVYHARQVRLDRPCALKMILAGAYATPEAVARFLAEARAIARLRHPHVVQIYHIGEADGLPFLELEYVEGGSLDRKLDGIPWTPDRAARLAEQLARGIAEAHRLGIVHRDLKPGNVLLASDGVPKITDFGLAKALGSESGLTRTESIMGSPSYMAPEQAEGRASQAGPAADVYALGATLYALVVGRPPFQAATPIDTVLQVINEEPISPRRLNASIPLDLESICLKCLAKEPAKRYASAAALAEDLRRYLNGEPIVARPVTPFERATKWARRRPAIAALGFATTAATILGVAGIVWQWRKAEANLAEADSQRSIAQQKSREATEKAQSLERQLYFNRVNLAQREWMSNSSSAAEAMLSRCPLDLRDWEWSYIHRLCHLDNLTIEGFPNADRATGLGLWGMAGLAFSPDGRRVASADPEYRVRVWDAITGGLARTMTGHSDRVYAIAFSPDGRLLATGSRDTTIRLWDAATGACVRTLEPHGTWIRSVAFSPDGTRLVSGSGGELFTPRRHGEVILWAVASGREIRRFAGPHDRTYGVAYRPDGKQIASVNCESNLKLWDPETGALERRLTGHSYYIECVAYSPDGRTLATGSRDHTAILWDVASGRVLHTLRGHDCPISSLAFNPDGQTFATRDTQSGIKVWDVARGVAIAHVRNSSRAINLQFSPDGRFLAAAGGDSLVKLWETASLADIECRALGGHRGWCFRAEYTQDGRTLVTSGWGVVRVWDATSGRHLRDIETGIPTGVYALAIRPDGRVLATAQERGPKDVDLWDMGTHQRLRKLVGHGATVKAVAFHPDGRTLASASEDRTIRIWDTLHGRALSVLEEHAATVVALAFSPDGRRLASKGWDHTVRLWDVATRRVIRVHQGVQQHFSDAYANGVAFSADGRLLAASRGDGRVNLWDVQTGAEVLTLSGHDGPVNAVAFLGGRRIVTTSDDRSIKVWDAATGETVLTLRGHTGPVLGVACRPDGTQFATTGTDDGRLWSTAVPSAQVRHEARILAWLQSLYERHGDKAKVAEDIRAERSLDDENRATALRLVAALPEDPTLLRIPDDPTLLNDTSWSIVVNTKLTAEEYRRALRYAEAACRLAPQESMFISTLGVARYRAGQYREALADLNRSLTLNVRRFGGPIPADLAFIAMAQHRLGQAGEARKTFEQLRDVMGRKRWSDNPESKAFLAESTFLIVRPASREPDTTRSLPKNNQFSD